MLHKKMVETIMTQAKKAESSDYQASNYTQIGDYRLGLHLGAGAYASVKQATHRATCMVVAIKIYEKSKLVEAQRKRSVLREVSILKKLQHKNILHLFDVIDSPKQLYLVMEFAQGHNLYTYMRRAAPPIASDDTKSQSKTSFLPPD